MNKFGIENIKKIVLFALGFTQQISVALADGKFQWTDGFGFIDELTEIPDVVKSFPSIKQEIADLNTEERKQLEEFIILNFNLPKAEIAAAIESSLSFALSAVALYQQFKALKK